LPGGMNSNRRWTLTGTAAAALVSIPGIFIISTAAAAIPETIIVPAAGTALCFLLRSKNIEKAQSAKIVAELENTRQKLQQNLDNLNIVEKRLVMLNSISATLYGSLELAGVFEKAYGVDWEKHLDEKTYEMLKTQYWKSKHVEWKSGG